MKRILIVLGIAFVLLVARYGYSAYVLLTLLLTPNWSSP